MSRQPEVDKVNRRVMVVISSQKTSKTFWGFDHMLMRCWASVISHQPSKHVIEWMQRKNKFWDFHFQLRIWSFGVEEALSFFFCKSIRQSKCDSLLSVSYKNTIINYKNHFIWKNNFKNHIFWVAAFYQKFFSLTLNFELQTLHFTLTTPSRVFGTICFGWKCFLTDSATAIIKICMGFEVNTRRLKIYSLQDFLLKQELCKNLARNSPLFISCKNFASLLQEFYM